MHRTMTHRTPPSLRARADGRIGDSALALSGAIGFLLHGDAEYQQLTRDALEPDTPAGPNGYARLMSLMRSRDARKARLVRESGLVRRQLAYLRRHGDLLRRRGVKPSTCAAHGTYRGGAYSAALHLRQTRYVSRYEAIERSLGLIE